MKIDSEEAALSAIDLCLTSSIKEFEFSGWPVVNLKIQSDTKLGLYSEELYGLLELQKAINDQYYHLQKRYTEPQKLQPIKNDAQIYYEFSKGSVNIDINLAETLKVFFEHMSLIRASTPSEFAQLVIWGLLFTSPVLMFVRASVKKKEIIAKRDVEIKKLEQYEKISTLIDKSEELKYVEGRMHGAYGKVLSKLRKGSVLLNHREVDDEFRQLIYEQAQCSHGNIISGRFVIERITKKEKERYLITIRSVDRNETYSVTLNMDIYQKRLIE